MRSVFLYSLREQARRWEPKLASAVVAIFVESWNIKMPAGGQAAMDHFKSMPST